jgi:hypothetical protein
MLSLFRRSRRPGPNVFSNLAAGRPKKNLRVCCDRSGRTVLFCEECHGLGYEYLDMTHREGCNTAHALTSGDVRPISNPIAVAV